MLLRRHQHGAAAIVSCLGLTLASPASAAEPASGAEDWTVSSSSSGCSAARLIAGSTPVVVMVQRSYRGEQADITLIGLEIPVPAPDLYSTAISVRTSADGNEIAKGSAFRTPGDNAALAKFRTRLNKIGEQRFREGLGEDASLIFSTRGQDILTVPAGNFTTKAADLEECFERVGQELLNARPEGESDSRMSRGPLPRNNRAAWVRVSDYRSRWLRDGLKGTVQFDLTVSQYGFVEGCEITRSAGDERLDAGTCRLVKRRARFFPARNEAQKAVEGKWSSAVRWVIPE